MLIQDLNIYTDTLIRLFKKFPNTGIAFIFRRVREQGRFSAYGDFVILSFINRTALSLGIAYSRREINYAFNQSSELSSLSKKEKTILLDQLLDASNGGLK